MSAGFVVFTITITDFGNAVVIGGDFPVLATEIYTVYLSSAASYVYKRQAILPRMVHTWKSFVTWLPTRHCAAVLSRLSGLSLIHISEPTRRP